MNSCAAGAEAGACLDERGSSSHAILASTNDLLVIKQAALQDYLNGHGASGLNNSLDISDNVVVIASDQVATVDDHVNLGSAVGNALLGLGHLSCSRSGAQRETDAGSNANSRALELGVSQGNPTRIDCDGRKLVLLCLGAKFLDVLSGCVLLQICMVDKAVDFHDFLLLAMRL